MRTISETDGHAAPPVLTGERTAPGIWHETYWYARHLAAYQALADRCRDRVVLEAGCGEGYGCAVLGEGARAVLGLDYDGAALARAARRYGGAAGFARANLVGLPLAAASVDVVVSLQVIEHIWSPAELLAQTARVLRPDGLLALTTPNRLTFSPGLARDARPTNPFHVKEYDADELATLVARHLDVVAVGGVHAGPRLRELDGRFGSLVDAQLATDPSQWAPELVAAVTSVRPEDFDVRADDSDGALDLLVLARSRSTGGLA